MVVMQVVPVVGQGVHGSAEPQDAADLGRVDLYAHKHIKET